MTDEPPQKNTNQRQVTINKVPQPQNDVDTIETHEHAVFHQPTYGTWCIDEIIVDTNPCELEALQIRD